MITGHAPTAETILITASRAIVKPIIMRRNNYEKVSSALVVLRPGHGFRPVPDWRICRPLGKAVTDMEGLENLISMLDYVLDTKRKRQITGGILLSVSLLFGGLAMTVMSIKDLEEDSNEEND